MPHYSAMEDWLVALRDHGLRERHVLEMYPIYHQDFLQYECRSPRCRLNSPFQTPRGIGITRGGGEPGGRFERDYQEMVTAFSDPGFVSRRAPLFQLVLGEWDNVPWLHRPGEPTFWVPGEFEDREAAREYLLQEPHFVPIDLFREPSPRTVGRSRRPRRGGECPISKEELEGIFSEKEEAKDPKDRFNRPDLV